MRADLAQTAQQRLDLVRLAVELHRPPCIADRGIPWKIPSDGQLWAQRSTLHPVERQIVSNTYWQLARDRMIYVGGTQLPLRRFVGDEGIADLGMGPASADRPMDGHKYSTDCGGPWECMHIFGVRVDHFGADAETDCIHYCKYALDPEQSRGELGNLWVRNKALDPRGLTNK